MIPAEALAAVPGAAGGAPPPRVAPLAGGLVNRSYQVTTAAGDFVLRLNAAPRAALELGVERRVEWAAQRLAAAAGLAPRLLAVAPDGSWQVSEFIAGEVADAARLATPHARGRLGVTLARLRELDVDGAQGAALPAGASLIERARALLAHATRRQPDAAGEFDALLERAERGWLASGAAARAARCLVHSDPGPGNVLLPDGAPCAVLVDWEYAHRGDLLQDPAAWLQAVPALRGEAAQVLRACGLADHADEAMLAGMVQVYDSIERAWERLAATAAGVPRVGRAN